METGWITLPVNDAFEPGAPARHDLQTTCIVCGLEGCEREVHVRGANTGRQTWCGLHRRCEAKLKKEESEELHGLYEQLAAVQERCTEQEQEIRALPRVHQEARGKAEVEVIIAKLRLENWMPYGGVHELNLGPGAHAIVARRKDDEESSNWAGKSALLEAVRFAVYGALPTGMLTPGPAGWITTGQDRGAVELHFDDGSMMRRSRAPGQSTSMVFMRPDSPQALMGAEADAALVEAVGLDEDDRESDPATSARARPRASSRRTRGPGPPGSRGGRGPERLAATPQEGGGGARDPRGQARGGLAARRGCPQAR